MSRVLSLCVVVLISCSEDGSTPESSSANALKDVLSLADSTDAKASKQDTDATNTQDGASTDIVLPAIPLPIGMKPLVDASLWEVLDPSTDPYWSDDQTITRCNDLQYEVETGVSQPVFSVTTSECAWLTARQKLLEDIPAGSTLEVTIWHFAIVTGDAPYELSVAMDSPDNVLWTKKITVPALDGDLFTESFQAPEALSAGTPVWFHLKNHGDNEWWIVGIMAPSDEPITPVD